MKTKMTEKQQMELRKTINRNFKIKVCGYINGMYVNTLVGVRGLLVLLEGCWEKVEKFVNRAFKSMSDKCRCKVYRGVAVTFYAK